MLKDEGGASAAAHKNTGVGTGLIPYVCSAYRCVEDDGENVLTLGRKVIGSGLPGVRSKPFYRLI